MKKVLYVFLIFQVLSIMSCCTEEYTIVGVAELYAFEDKYSYDPISTIEGAFVLFSELEINIASNVFQELFVNELHATTCGEEYLNAIDPASVVVTVDKAFEFNGQSIPAGTNLTDLDGVLKDVGQAILYVEFTSDFVDNADFLNELYSFDLQFGTTDGRTLNKSVPLMMGI